jgi:hypothetical protein
MELENVLGDINPEGLDCHESSPSSCRLSA